MFTTAMLVPHYFQVDIFINLGAPFLSKPLSVFVFVTFRFLFTLFLRACVRPSLLRFMRLPGTGYKLRIRIVAERAKANAKKDEQRRVEAKRQEEELMAVCYVCHSGDHSDEDSIVFCDRCCVAVHTSCYDAQGVRGWETRLDCNPRTVALNCRPRAAIRFFVFQARARRRCTPNAIALPLPLSFHSRRC